MTERQRRMKMLENKIRQLARRYMAEDIPRTRRKLRENKNDTGLIVTPRTLADTNKMKEILDDSDYYAVWDPQYGHFFFPEDEGSYDDLERELDKLFNQHDVNYRIEGVF